MSGVFLGCVVWSLSTYSFSGFYPLVPTWTLVRGSKTAIRWKDSKRSKKKRSGKQRRSIQNDIMRKHGRLYFEGDGNRYGILAPQVVPVDLLPLYIPESEFIDQPSGKTE